MGTKPSEQDNRPKDSGHSHSVVRELSSDQGEPVYVRSPDDADGQSAQPNLAYIPALDGVRAFAVVGVMAYHGGIPFLPAGFLGVDAFFVLSGFLITTLLLGEWRRRATIRLRAFWARRARRLLPALLLVLLFVVWFSTVVAPGTYQDLRSDALATLFYFANWHFILAGSNYFVQTGPVSPLTHTWSLAIEEQFYLVWPLIVLAILKLTRDLRILLWVCSIGIVGSALEMALLYRHGVDLTRLYYGTDTHAQSLLIGALLAALLAILADRRRTRPDPGSRRSAEGDAAWWVTGVGGRRLLAVLGGAGVLGLAFMWSRLSYSGWFLWQGGFLVAGLATASVLACVVCSPRSWLARGLSITPLRFLGRISYGLYLWHLPLFQWLDGERTGLTGYPLFGVRCAATLAAATASFYLVERPIRQGNLLRHWRAWVATPVAIGTVLAVILVGASSSSAFSADGSTLRVSPTSIAGGDTTRVLLVGDSTAFTISFGLAYQEAKFHAQLVNGAIIGCGVIIISAAEIDGIPGPADRPCNSASSPSEQWPAIWSKWIKQLRPQVVAILAGRWEVADVEWRGRWTNILSPTFAAYVRSQLTLAVRVATSEGAHAVVMTAPCYASGEQPNGQPWPEDQPQRLRIYNQLVKSVVSSSAGAGSLANLDGIVCPDGQFHESLDGVTIRSSDGVHFPVDSLKAPDAADPNTAAQVRAFGVWLNPKIWPELLRK
jgi:peptidoglycan/LPS O-acetylase OafA/YrhL